MHKKTQTEKNIIDPQKIYYHGTVSKNMLLEGFKRVHVANPRPTNVDQDT